MPPSGAVFAAVFALLGVILAMALVILARRGLRQLLELRRRPYVERARRELVRIVADEDASIAELAGLGRRETRALELTATAMLEKTRGVSGERIADALEAIGTVARARRRVRRPGAIGRRRAAMLLGMTRREDDLPRLVPLLTDRSPDVRLAAASAISALGHADSAVSLLASADGRRRLPAAPLAAATLALGQPAVEALRQALRQGEPIASLIAANVLGQLNGVSAVPDLCGTLDGHKGADVRHAAAVALGTMGSPDAVPALAAALQSDHATSVRSAAATALGEIGSSGANAALRLGLVDRSPDVARASAMSLARSGARGEAVLVEMEAPGGPAAAYAAEALWLRRLAESKRRPNSRVARAA